MPLPEQPTIRIRRCTVDDAPALTALARATFRETFADTCSEADMQHFLDTIYAEKRIAAELADPDDHIYFALDGEEPAGYLRFLESPLPFPADGVSRPLELNRLYVDARNQGRGLAPRLMDVFLDYAEKNGCDFLWLGVWEHNYRAQAFYRRYGFSFTGHGHPFPIGDTPQTDEWWAVGK